MIGDLRTTAKNLEQTLEKLLASEKRPCWQKCRPSHKLSSFFEPAYSLQSFLIGPDKLHASPHLSIVTADQWVAKELKAFITQSQILAAFPRWGCFRLPAHVKLTSTANDVMSPADTGESRKGNRMYEICIPGDEIPRHLNGVLVEVWKEENLIGKATIGGFLSVGDRILALSTAHSFSPRQPTTADTFQIDESDLEFLADDFNHDDQSGMDVPSSLLAIPQHPCLQSYRTIDPSTMGTQLVLSPPSQRRTTIGYLEHISRVYDPINPSNGGLDWALIAITHPKIVVGNQPHRPRTNENITNGDSSVNIVTSSHSIDADIVSSALFGPAPNASPRSALVANNGDINPGDSGSWCFGQSSGEVVGMVLGNCQSINQCYLLKMKDVNADIETQLGSHVEVAPTVPLSRLVQPNFLRFVDDQKCCRIDESGDETHYITIVSLREYWSPDLISSVLTDSGLGRRFDSEHVSKDFLRIWSTLVYIDAPEQFQWFFDQGINDSQLPIKREHAHITQEMRSFFDRFDATQGLFCPVLERARISSKISNNPIVQHVRSRQPPNRGSTSPDILSAIQAQCSKEGNFSVLSIYLILRDHFPKYLIYQVDKSTCNLRDFTGPGRAQLTLDEQTDHFASLRYDRKATRITNTESLKADFLFAKYNYSWRDTDFVLFVFASDRLRGDQDEYHFLLTPRDTTTAEGGLHPKARELSLAAGQYTSQAQKKISLFKQSRSSYLDLADDVMWGTMPSHSWDDIIMDSARQGVLAEDINSFFTSSQLLKEFNLPWKRGIIFHGPTGTGKTTIMKALMAMLADGKHLVPSIYVKLTNQHDLLPSKIHDIFSRARQQAPCLLVLEDLDWFVSEESRSTFLDEWDHGNNDGILILGSTRDIQKLNPAIRDRPGRFYSKFECKLPEYNERLVFAKQWKSKLEKHCLVDLTEDACGFIAKLTEGFDYARLKDLFSTLLFYRRAEPCWDPQTTDKGDATSLSARHQAFSEVTIPESLHDNCVVRFLHQQTIILLQEMESEADTGPGCITHRHDIPETESSMADLHIQYRHKFDPDTPGSISGKNFADTENTCPGCMRRLQDAENTAVVAVPASRNNSDDACPGCTRKAVRLWSEDDEDACPGCTRRLQDATSTTPVDVPASQNDSDDACPGCTRKERAIEDAVWIRDKRTDAPLDACPGCTKRAIEDAARTRDKRTDASLQACPGCTKKAAENIARTRNKRTDASLEACPSCTRQATDNIARASANAIDNSLIACPGCKREANKDTARTSDKATDTSTDAYPSCEAREACNAVLQDAVNDGTDPSTDACPPCTARTYFKAELS